MVTFTPPACGLRKFISIKFCSVIEEFIGTAVVSETRQLLKLLTYNTTKWLPTPNMDELILPISNQGH